MTREYNSFNGVLISNSMDAPTEAEFAALETTLQTKLPASFRSFLSAANGGTMDGYCIDIAHPEKPVSRCFSTVFGTKARNQVNGYGHFDKEIELSREAAQLPPQVLPFAKDGSGCEAFLDLTEDGAGRVVVFVMGIPGHDEQPEDNAWVTVALSFDDYLKQLRVDVEDLKIRLDQATNNGDDESCVWIVDFLNQTLPDWRKKEEFTAHKAL